MARAIRNCRNYCNNWTISNEVLFADASGSLLDGNVSIVNEATEAYKVNIGFAGSLMCTQ